MSRPLAPRPLAFSWSVATPTSGPYLAIGCATPAGRVGDVRTGIRSLTTGLLGPLKT